jgi:glycosyltransferase involved in cell wall biosynthesis
MKTTVSTQRAGLDLAPPARSARPVALSPAKARALKIAWYRTGEMRQLGGGERVMREGLRVLREAGADVRVLLHEPLTSTAEAWFAASAPHFEVVPGFALSDVQERRDGPSHSAGRFLERVRSLRRTLARYAPDLIFAESPIEARFLWVYALGGRLALPPVVTFIHGSPFQFDDDATKYGRVFRRHFDHIRDADPVYRAMIPDTPPPMPAAARLRFEAECVAQRAGVRMSRTVFVLSEKNRREVERLYGVGSAVVASPGGFGRGALRGFDTAAPERAANRNRGPYLLSVCRLIAKKRVDLLLRAFRAFVDRNPGSRVSLVIGGDGPERANLVALTATLGLDARVRFMGFIPEPALPAWYRGCDAFLSADNADYDLSVMAALPAGRRIVVSTQYDIPQALDQVRRFFFVAEPTVDGFAGTIECALATDVAPPGPADAGELDALTWERYFATILDHGWRAIAPAPRATRTAP